MVYSYFVFSFDAIFEIVTAMCFFVANLRVGSPGASELHYLGNVFLLDPVIIIHIMHDVIIFCLYQQNIKI